MKNTQKLVINEAIFYLCSDIASQIGSLGYEKKVIAEIDHKESLVNIMKSLLPASLNLEQTSDLVDVASVSKEASNLLALHENITDFNPLDIKDMLEAHSILIGSESSFRHRDLDSKNFIYPDYKDVPKLIKDLFDVINANSLSASWLITASHFRYEFENIHPFLSYNSEIGRFWQRVLLFRGYYIFAFAPLVEDEQEYCQVLQESRKKEDPAIFVEYSLRNIFKNVKAYVREIKRMRLRGGSNLADRSNLHEMDITKF